MLLVRVVESTCHLALISKRPNSRLSNCLQAALGRLKKCTTKEITANINRR
jgi:hypothetical protein